MKSHKKNFQARRKIINIMNIYFKILRLQMCAKSIKIKIKKKLNKVFRNKNKIYSQYTTQLMKEKNNFQKEEKKSNSKSMKMEMKLI